MDGRLLPQSSLQLTPLSSEQLGNPGGKPEEPEAGGGAKAAGCGIGCGYGVGSVGYGVP